MTARCCCQILLDLYYTSDEAKRGLTEQGLIHEPTGKAIVGGKTLVEVFEKWGTEEIWLLVTSEEQRKEKGPKSMADESVDVGGVAQVE